MYSESRLGCGVTARCLAVLYKRVLLLDAQSIACPHALGAARCMQAHHPEPWWLLVNVRALEVRLGEPLDELFL